MTKTCTACSEAFSLVGHWKDASQKDGYHRLCKPCHRKRYKQKERMKPREDGLIRCPKCDTAKERIHFYASGLSRGSAAAGWCKPCMKASQKTPEMRRRITEAQGRLRAEKRQYVQDKKTAIGCACGEKHPACLEWHHTGEQEKEESLCRMIDQNRPYDVLDAEMAKCVVLCSNCHRKQHWESEDRSKYRSLMRSA